MLFPAIIMPISFVASLVSRHRNKDKAEDDEYESEMKKMQMDRGVRMQQAMQRLDFVTKTAKDQKEITEEYDRGY